MNLIPAEVESAAGEPILAGKVSIMHTPELQRRLSAVPKRLEIGIRPGVDPDRASSAGPEFLSGQTDLGRAFGRAFDPRSFLSATRR